MFALLLILSIIWLLVLLVVYDKLTARTIHFLLPKIMELKEANFKMGSISMSFIIPCIHIKNFSIYITHIGNIEISNVRIKLNQKSHQFNNPANSVLTRKLFWVELSGLKINSNAENLAQIETNLKKLPFLADLILKLCIFDLDFLSIRVNSLLEGKKLIIQAERLLLALAEFSAVSDILNNCFLIPKSEDSSSQNEVGSILANLINLNVLIKQNKEESMRCINFGDKDDEYFKVLNLDVASLQLNYGKLPAYKHNEASEALDPFLVLDLVSSSYFKIHINAWNELAFSSQLKIDELVQKFLSKSLIMVFRVQLKKYTVNLSKSSDNLFKLNDRSTNSSQYSKIEIIANLSKEDPKINASFDLIQPHVYTFLNSKSLLEFTQAEFLLDINRKRSKFSLNSTSPAYINFHNLQPPISLLTLFVIEAKKTLSSFKIRNEIEFDVGLSECLISLPVNNDNGLSLKMSSVRAKIKAQDAFMLLLVLDNAELFTKMSYFKHVNKSFRAKCERIVVESVESVADSKIQLVCSPIIIGNFKDFESKKPDEISNSTVHSHESYLYTCIVNEGSTISLGKESSNQRLSATFKSAEEKLNTNNCIYLTNLQLRHEQLKHSNKPYSNQTELLIGDAFGTIDINTLVNLVNLSASFCTYIHNEIESFAMLKQKKVLNELSYISFRALTSLTQINLLSELNSESLNYETKFNQLAVFNLTLSPINYGECDFHCVNSSKGCLCVLPDVHLKILTSFDSSIKLDYLKERPIKYLNMVEVGFVYINSISYYSPDKLSEAKLRLSKLSFVKENDQESKRLRFLWEPELEDSCFCVNASGFFSAQRLYAIEENCARKPCVYIENSEFGFGQSILVPNEPVFFSYRRFMDDEGKATEHKISSGRKFIVLANMERDDAELKRKFEPIQMCVYENELNKFLSESLNVNYLSKFSSDRIVLNSANMSPPYFSNDFNIYIKYLPIVRNVTAVSFKPKSNGSSIISLNKSALNTTPYSDLKDGLKFWNKLNTRRNTEFRPKEVISVAKRSSSLSLNSYELDLKENDEISGYLNYLNGCRLNMNQLVSGFKLNQNRIIKKKLCIEEVFMKNFYKPVEPMENDLKRLVLEKSKTASERVRGDEASRLGLETSSSTCDYSNISMLFTPQSLDSVLDFAKMLLNYETIEAVGVDLLAKHRIDGLQLHLFSLDEANSQIQLFNVCLDELTIEKQKQDKEKPNKFKGYDFKIKSIYNHVFPNCDDSIEKMIIQFEHNAARLIDFACARQKFAFKLANTKEDAKNRFQFELDFILVEKYLSLSLNASNYEDLTHHFLDTNKYKQILNSIDTIFSSLKLDLDYKLNLNLNAIRFNFDTTIQSGELIADRSIGASVKSLNVSLWSLDRPKLKIESKIQLEFYKNDTQTGIYQPIASCLFDISKSMSGFYVDLSLLLNTVGRNKFYFNLILPMNSNPNIKRLNESLTQFECVNLMVKAYDESDNLRTIFYLLDLSLINVKFNNKKEALISVDKMRLARSHIELEPFEMILSIPDLLSDFIIKIDIKTLMYTYFAESFNDRSWYYLKLNQLEVNYADYSEHMEQVFNVKFKDMPLRRAEDLSLLNAKHSLMKREDKYKSIALAVSTQKTLLPQKGSHEWLDFVCMESDLLVYKLQVVAVFSNVEFAFRVKYKSNWEFHFMNANAFNSILIDLKIVKLFYQDLIRFVGPRSKKLIRIRRTEKDGQMQVHFWTLARRSFMKEEFGFLDLDLLAYLFYSRLFAFSNLFQEVEEVGKKKIKN